MESLQKASFRLGEIIYEKSKAQQQAPAGDAEGATEEKPSEDKGEEGEDVVDADFEVKQ